ncbi:MAG TPA: YXWGXW repeat-containing protein [Verrucomicrobiae bacterium]|nr:YXWGXW repeat-containing protein [Verrucomicrobiae bacterium]
MKTRLLILTVAGAAVLLSGCMNPDGTQNNTGSGAVIGGAVGAITGAAIGGPRHGGEGALIGAGAGAAGGGLIGYSMDREQQGRLRQQAPVTYTKMDQDRPLSVADVMALAKAGISEDVIISQIQNSHTVYHLSATDIIDLRDSGVPDPVVNYMINTPNTVASSPPPTVTVVQPPPPPPVETAVVTPVPGYVWIAGEWVWGGASWVWVAGHWGHPPYPHAVWISGRRWHDAYGWHYDRGHWH